MTCSPQRALAAVQPSLCVSLSALCRKWSCVEVTSLLAPLLGSLGNPAGSRQALGSWGAGWCGWSGSWPSCQVPVVTPVVPGCSLAQRQWLWAGNCWGDLADRPRPRSELHQPQGSGGECKHPLLQLGESPQGFPSFWAISTLSLPC